VFLCVKQRAAIMANKDTFVVCVPKFCTVNLAPTLSI